MLAPGPQGRPYYRQIPDDFYVVAVSKAVLIPEVEAQAWVMNHADQPWFREAHAAFDGLRIFRDEAVQEAEAVLGRNVVHYRYEALRGRRGLTNFRPRDGEIMSGGSVTGCAIQIAYNVGARDILLCGVDMSGDGYFDGTTNIQPEHGDVWNVVQYLDPLLRWMMEERGVRIATLSPTRLAVPTFAPALEEIRE